MADKKPTKQPKSAVLYNMMVENVKQLNDAQLADFMSNPKYAETRKALFSVVIENANETGDFSVVNAIRDGLRDGPIKDDLTLLIEPEKYAEGRRTRAQKRMQEQNVGPEALKNLVSKYVKTKDGKYVPSAQFAEHDATSDTYKEQKQAAYTRFINDGVDSPEFVQGFRNSLTATAREGVENKPQQAQQQAQARRSTMSFDDEVIEGDKTPSEKTAPPPAEAPDATSAEFKKRFEAVYPDGFKKMDPHQIASKVAVLGGTPVIEGPAGELLDFMTGQPYKPPVVAELPPPMDYSVPSTQKPPQSGAKPPKDFTFDANATSAVTGKPVNMANAENPATQEARNRLAQLPQNFMAALAPGGSQDPMLAPRAQAAAAPPAPAGAAVEQFIAADQ